MAKIEYLFRETAAGLRRNGVLAFAAMLTATIALFLFGMSLLIAREFELITTAITKNVEVQVYLTDPVNQDTVGRLTTRLQELPAVEDVQYWNKQRTCAEFYELFEGQDVFVDREVDKLQINNAFVSGQVIRTDNGVIYVIDSVLLPQYR